MDLALKSVADGVSFAVKAVPRASRNAIAEVREGVLVVRLCAPPVEGKANAALIAYLAEAFGLRKGQVSIKVGEKSRHKIVVLSGMDPEQVRERIEALLG